MSLELFEEHLNEAAFLWHQREHTRLSPRHTPDDVEALEWRLLRHVDGLVLAGASTAERKLIPLLEEGDAEAASVATLVLLSPDVWKPEAVLSTLKNGDLEHRDAIGHALRARPCEELKAPLYQLLGDSPQELQALLLDVLADWCALSPTQVEPFLTGGAPVARAAALRAASRLTAPTLASRVADSLASGDVDVQWEAIVTGLSLGVEGAWAMCRQLATRQEPRSANARLMLAFGGRPPDQHLLMDALTRPEPLTLRKQTLWALGFSGSRDAVSAVIPLMSSQEPLMDRLAGEAFSAITGRRLDDTWTRDDDDDAPEDDRISLTESWLPRPRPDRVADWWNQNQSRFSPSVRYLDGLPCSPVRLRESFEQGTMRRREALAVELRIRSRGAWNPPLRAFLQVQHRDLSRLRALESRMKDAPFETLTRAGAPPAPLPTSPERASRPLAVHPDAESSVVTAMGMVSSLALGVVASCAAARAGLVHATELEGCEALDPSDGQSYPVRGHAIAALTRGFNGLGRLARLGEAALRELRDLGRTGGKRRTGLYVALPSGAHASAHERLIATEDALEDDADEPPRAAAQLASRISEELLPLLVRLTGLHIPREHQRVFPQDALGFLRALTEAQQALRQGLLDRCIVGGIDSLVEPVRLQALKALGLLKVPSQPSRMLPGEAAAFLVLERHKEARQHGAPVLATCEAIRAPSVLVEKWEGPAKAGRALANTLAETLSSLTDQGQRTGQIIGGLNGHDRRAYSWGHALPILEPRMLGQLPLWSPAESFGELGAATGAVAVCMAVRDFARGATASPHSLVWLMGDEGDSGSFYVRTTLQQRMSEGEHA
ncbi:TIGR02270 family protein [Comamonas sp. JC664]|uniref:TIGR02270 family protein n=1 Tax=Comamonas sp. JC664 TaxID=2801917 RepID=UPI00174B4591|nr:TIGR02270 family protein [Comamonas sp. JC664]MBL0696455.1 TIGR02270 family protein [Comamonas sp. JC664]GHG84319.1 hypothetical protein GCM10012319_39790 [Comamonas sp. KCTC 72670]